MPSREHPGGVGRGILTVGAVLAACGTAACLQLTAPVIGGEPEFLGEYSGMYRAVDERMGVAGGTFVVQFRDRLLLTHFTESDGTVHFGSFARVLELDESASGRQVLPTQDVAMLVRWREFLGDGTTCNDDPAPTDTADFIATLFDCGGEGCALPCFLVDPSAVTTGRSGTCVDGIACRYDDIRIGTVIDARGLELYFDQLAVTPPSRSFIPCPEGEDWATCFRFEKQCEFDSTMAGVFAIEITPPAGSGGTRRTFDAAVALANDVRGAALFSEDIVLLGTFDPISGELSLDSGAPGQPQHQPDATATITLTASVDVVSDAVRITGTWTETVAGEDAVTYTLSGQRSTGSTPGRVCQRSDCLSEPVVCPGGPLVPPANQLLLQPVPMTESCVFHTCTRAVVSPTGLCPDSELDCRIINDPVTVRGAPMLLSAMAIEVGCNDGGATCAPNDSCLRLSCIPEVAGLGQLAWVHDACLDPATWPAGAMLISFEPAGGMSVLVCPASFP